MSLECDDNGSPLLQLSPPDITVHSFYHLSNLLQLSKDKTMKEIRACLEGDTLSTNLSDVTYYSVIPYFL